LGFRLRRLNINADFHFEQLISLNKWALMVDLRPDPRRNEQKRYHRSLHSPPSSVRSRTGLTSPPRQFLGIRPAVAQ
jgi:hypothetical protein